MGLGPHGSPILQGSGGHALPRRGRTAQHDKKGDGTDTHQKNQQRQTTHQKDRWNTKSHETQSKVTEGQVIHGSHLRRQHQPSKQDSAPHHPERHHQRRLSERLSHVIPRPCSTSLQRHPYERLRPYLCHHHERHTNVQEDDAKQRMQ